MKTSEMVTGYSQDSRTNIELQDAGAAIRDYRSKCGYTQSQLGDAAGLGKAQVCRIEGSDNLTVGTVSKLFEAMGAKVYLNIEDSEEDTESFVYEAVDLISEFASLYEIPLAKAYSYLDTFGGLDFLRRFFLLEQSYSREETLEHLRLICRQKGGEI